MGTCYSLVYPFGAFKDACREGKCGIVEKCIKLGHKDALLDDGSTPLYIASQYGV